MFVSYAQNFEDVMLWRALGKLARGFYIDVRADESTEHSVTKAFYTRGWRGINIEPTRFRFDKLAAEQPGDINLHMAAAEAQTLSSICERFVRGPIHFINIDLGKSETNVLPEMDWARWRPWILLIEGSSSRKLDHADWEDLILQSGYISAYWDGLNRFYVATEHKDLLTAFTHPPNEFDLFITSSQFESLRCAQDAESRAAQAEDELLQARADLRLLERRAQQASRRLQEREALLEATYRSLSWRITAPVRAVGNAMYRRLARRNHLRRALLARPDSPTLFIECTHTYHSDLNTGIQRVVRNVLRNAAISAARYGYAVIPVVLESSQFVATDLGQVLADKSRVASPDVGVPENASTLAQNSWRLLLRTLTALLPFASVQRFLFASPDRFGLAWCIVLPLRALRLRPWPERRPKPISLDQYASCAGSILLLLDSSWTFPIWPAVKRFRRHGGKVAGVVYDLIPITHPHTSVPQLTIAFKAWLQEHVRHTDAFIGISRSTADQVAQFISSLPDGCDASRHPAAIDHFHLGAELDLVELADEPRPDVKRIFDVERHMFLMVGTFEPRKNHSHVLDAFDAYWAQGGDAALVMIGRQAWKTEAFLERVANHEQLDRRLFLVRDATDSELDYAYRNASALIIASVIEGFGLPVAEAFQRGLPVLCSDIPVFREIAEGKATFFDLSDSDNLADALTEFCRSHDVTQRDARMPQSWITWRESTDQLCAAIMRALAREAGPVTSPAGT